METPKHYQTVMPYLIVNDAEGMLSFLKMVFGAEEIVRYNTDQGRIMHAEINIGGSTIMMGESNDQWSPRSSSLYVQVADADATYQKALAKGAKVLHEPEDKEYGRAAGIEDLYGNAWWITSALTK